MTLTQSTQIDQPILRLLRHSQAHFSNHFHVPHKVNSTGGPSLTGTNLSLNWWNSLRRVLLWPMPGSTFTMCRLLLHTHIEKPNHPCQQNFYLGISYRVCGTASGLKYLKDRRLTSPFRDCQALLGPRRWLCVSQRVSQEEVRLCFHKILTTRRK